ncbi:MAG: malonyl-CoA synthase [Gammaproteobacteria bacterium]|nr:malonyl-CoA synthase [Gammaproteobacteria bacterium]
MSGKNFNLYSHFSDSFSGKENKAALVTTDGREFSFADINSISAKLANSLSRTGVKPGDRVTVQVRKSAENLCLYLACLRAGFVFHPLNLGYKRAELDYFIGDAEPAVIVCDSENEVSFDARRVFTLNGDGSGSLTDGANRMSGDFETVSRTVDDLAALLYSSGTTGVPKGIMLTHGNLLANTETLVKAWGFTAHDRLLHALPIFHVHGLFVAIGCVLLSGASMRWLPGYDAKQVIAFLPECTVMMGVPTYYTRLLTEESFKAEVCPNVRLFVSGSAPLLEETFVEFEARTGHRILERYGMTETNMNTSNPLDGERKPGTVGPPLPGVEVRITDDDGETLPTGEIGHLEVRGPNVFAGYWRMPEKTVEDFTDDGYFNTGDMGQIDADGYVAIVGRNKDLVITGGLNVYPKEVELFIDDLPGVKESAVIGVPHADFGEGVVAVVVAESDASPAEADVIKACKAQLANFKVPKRVLFVDELPRNTMAKIQKNVLRETYAQLLSQL